MEVLLPGGLLTNGRLERLAKLRPINGRIELQLAEWAEIASSTPEFVSNVLAASVSQIGPVVVTHDVVAALCVADRQYLYLHIAAILGGDDQWLESMCGDCGERMQMCFQRSRLPVKPAGDAFPETDWNHEGRKFRLRVPTGVDQIAISALPESDALQELLNRCVTPPPDGIDPTVVDAALEALSPEMCTLMQTHCPACGAIQTVALDPYKIVLRSTGDLYREVHRLASCYHWSERQILTLPIERRRQYLQWVEADQGMNN